VGWVLGEARVPEHGDGVLGDLEGDGTGRQAGGIAAPAEARRCREDEVALGDDIERGRELGDAEGDAASKAARLEHAVDDARAFAAR